MPERDQLAIIRYSLLRLNRYVSCANPAPILAPTVEWVRDAGIPARARRKTIEDARVREETEANGPKTTSSYPDLAAILDPARPIMSPESTPNRGAS